jgi:hypothetical protein
VVALALAASVLGALLPTGLIWLLAHLDDVGEWLVAFGRRCHLLPPAPVVTYDPPIERIAADLRRLSTERERMRAGTPAVRRRGLQMAYDGKLQAACRALQIPEALGEVAEGMDRELERVRVELALESAGLRFRAAAR